LRKPLPARESILMKTTTLRTMMRLVLAVAWQLTVVAATGMTSEMTLASSAAGRVVLHLVCAKRDHHFRWHWQGVLREFAKR
jgi:hypothetical protein